MKSKEIVKPSEQIDFHNEIKEKEIEIGSNSEDSSKTIKSMLSYTIPIALILIMVAVIISQIAGYTE